MNFGFCHNKDQVIYHFMPAVAMTTAVGMTVAANGGAAVTVGTGAAIIMGIETLSVAVGSFFGMLPTP